MNEQRQRPMSVSNAIDGEASWKKKTHTLCKPIDIEIADPISKPDCELHEVHSCRGGQPRMKEIEVLKMRPDALPSIQDAGDDMLVDSGSCTDPRQAITGVQDRNIQTNDAPTCGVFSRRGERLYVFVTIFLFAPFCAASAASQFGGSSGVLEGRGVALAMAQGAKARQIGAPDWLGSVPQLRTGSVPAWKTDGASLRFGGPPKLSSEGDGERSQKFSLLWLRNYTKELYKGIDF